MKMILTPVDLSPVSERVVETAADLARAVDGYVVLAHVNALPADAANYVAAVDQFVEAATAVEQQAETSLADWKARLQAQAIPCQTVRLTGYPHSLIPSLAEKFRADFVVMGSHGHSALHELLVGSTTKGVVARAKCPVVVVPDRARAKPARRPAPARRDFIGMGMP